MRYILLVTAALVTDVVSAFVVGAQLLYHMRLVRKGRTTLVPDDDSYDAGRATNWAQVFGTSWLWPLPLRNTGPTCNGFQWPECEYEHETKRV